MPSPRSDLAGWALDAGAAGIVVPRSETVDDVRAAVAATRYAQTRGAAPGVRAAGYGRDADYMLHADERRVLLIQIETAPALAAVDEIAAIGGVDVLFLGPADLARSLGLTGAAADHPEILHAAAHIAAAADGAGKAAGVYLHDPDHATAYREFGYSIIGSGSDSGLLRRAVDAPDTPAGLTRRQPFDEDSRPRRSASGCSSRHGARARHGRACAAGSIGACDGR